MGASVTRAQTIVSFKSAATLPAYVVVKPTTANHVGLWDTSTALIMGVTLDTSNNNGGSDSAVAIVVGGSAKVICGASVSTGALIAVQTATGYAIEAGSLPNTTSATFPRLLGISLQAGSTNSVIEVMLQINNHSKIAYA